MLSYWGPTQCLVKSVNTLNFEQICESINYVETLLNSKKFEFDENILINRLKDLKEQKEFLNRKC
ncbi:MAG TPA: hypothetical protein PLI22_08500 [Caldisericia bacterium]|jgi:hypothetical protein|nr:hypothetical protein [Caldisericia bacterium]